MDKQVFIDKITLLTDELQLIASNWIRNDYQIKPLEVETYLSNLKYLSEQAAILKKLLEEQQGFNSDDLHVHMSSIPTRKSESTIHTSFDSIEMEQTNSIEERREEIIESKTQTNTPEIQQDEFAAELSLHEKLSSKMKESTLADSLKNKYVHKDLSLSLNERFFYINELFNGDQKDFERVMQHLATLDSWEEVEFYLNATCVVPYAWVDKETQKLKLYTWLQERF